MHIEQIWTGNAYRNFNYLIACPETGETLAIDPLDYEKCLSRAKESGWEITQILNTHEHGDHTPLYSQAIHYLMLELETVAEEGILKNFMKLSFLN